MLIEDISTLKSIFFPITVLEEFQDKFKSNLDYLLINTDNQSWIENLRTQLENKKPEQLLAIGLIVKHLSDPNRTDAMFFMCRRQEIDSEFLDEISKYITPKSGQRVNILGMLQEKWKSESSSYPLLFWWTTRTDYNFTLISDNAVAPIYQNKGLMKKISLILIDLIADLYGENHNIKAIVIHPASYLLFHPHDKTLEQYHPEEIENEMCSTLKALHNEKPLPSSHFNFPPETIEALSKFSLLSSKSFDEEIGTITEAMGSQFKLTSNIADVD